MTKHRSSGCVTGKVRYKDGPQAKRALSTIKTKGEQRTSMPARAYQCDRCKGWHLTSWA